MAQKLKILEISITCPPGKSYPKIRVKAEHTPGVKYDDFFVGYKDLPLRVKEITEEYDILIPDGYREAFKANKVTLEELSIIKNTTYYKATEEEQKRLENEATWL